MLRLPPETPEAVRQAGCPRPNAQPPLGAPKRLARYALGGGDLVQGGHALDRGHVRRFITVWVEPPLAKGRGLLQPRDLSAGLVRCRGQRRLLLIGHPRGRMIDEGHPPPPPPALGGCRPPLRRRGRAVPPGMARDELVAGQGLAAATRRAAEPTRAASVTRPERGLRKHPNVTREVQSIRSRARRWSSSDDRALCVEVP